MVYGDLAEGMRFWPGGGGANRRFDQTFGDGGWHLVYVGGLAESTG